MNATKSRVIVKKLQSSMTTEGGIVLRSSNDYPKAVAVSVGPTVTSGIKPGDELIVDWRQVGRFEYLEQEYFIIHERDIMAIVE